MSVPFEGCLPSFSSCQSICVATVVIANERDTGTFLITSDKLTKCG